MTSPGRNDPCPCGSGRKYKHCCLGAANGNGRETGNGRFGPSPASDVTAELQQAIKERIFGSLDDVQAFASAFMRQRNETPADDFHGLSPEQMHRFLNFPYESPELIVFTDVLDIAPEAPVTKLMDLLVAAIGDRGLKATATGNLPRAFCREAALKFLGEEGYREHVDFAPINKEPDFHELHVVRIVADLAGLVRRYKGRYILSREARKLVAGPGAHALYPRLLRAATTKYNWSYTDRYPDLTILQHSFAFTLYLLHRYGDVEREQAFYEGAILRAFPMVLEEVEPSVYFSTEETVRRCYTLRVMERFAAFFGLVALRDVGERPLDRSYRIRGTPLLDAAVRFRLPAA